MEPEEYLIWLYLKVGENFKKTVGGARLRSRDFAPSLSDIELITIELFAEYQGHGNDKSIWRYMKQHWQNWFPELRSYKNFTKHCANLMIVKEKILTQLSMPKESDNFYIVDGVPLQICKFARANSSKIFAWEASFGYCTFWQENLYSLLTPGSRLRITFVVLAHLCNICPIISPCLCYDIVAHHHCMGLDNYP